MVRQPIEEKENSEFEPALPCLEISYNFKLFSCY